jgi:hypothetical protein
VPDQKRRRFDPATIRETVAMVGVILGLFFVGYETRQNTAVLRSQSVQTTAEMSRQNLMALVESRELREAYRIALVADSTEVLTRDQRTQLSFFTSATVRVMENRYNQIALGALDDPTAVGGAPSFYRSRWFRTWWAARRSDYPRGFQDWLDSEVLAGE